VSLRNYGGGSNDSFSSFNHLKKIEWFLFHYSYHCIIWLNFSHTKFNFGS